MECRLEIPLLLSGGVCPGGVLPPGLPPGFPPDGGSAPPPEPLDPAAPPPGHGLLTAQFCTCWLLSATSSRTFPSC